jgi:hypothetical protein
MSAITARLLLTGSVAVSQSACGIIGPSCVDLDEILMTTTAKVDAGEIRSFDVVSAQHSNLLMRLSWSDYSAALGMRATITSCGHHVGCQMVPLVPTFGPDPSPTPQPWPRVGSRLKETGHVAKPIASMSSAIPHAPPSSPFR